jgi:hypothetical protein
VVIEDAEVEFTDRVPSIESLAIDPCDDLYQAVYEKKGRIARRSSQEGSGELPLV